MEALSFRKLASISDEFSMSKDGLGLTDKEIATAFSDPRWSERFPPILTVDQAADLLSVPKATIYSWSSRGLLRKCGRKVGRHLRLFRDRLIKRILNEGINDTQ